MGVLNSLNYKLLIIQFNIINFKIYIQSVQKAKADFIRQVCVYRRIELIQKQALINEIVNSNYFFIC